MLYNFLYRNLLTCIWIYLRAEFHVNFCRVQRRTCRPAFFSFFFFFFFFFLNPSQVTFLPKETKRLPLGSQIFSKSPSFLDPRWLPEGSYKRVCPSFCSSVLPSIRLSGRFLWIVSLPFSKFWHGARNPYEVVRDRAKNRVFLIFWKIQALIFSEFGL